MLSFGLFVEIKYENQKFRLIGALASLVAAITAKGTYWAISFSSVGGGGIYILLPKSHITLSTKGYRKVNFSFVCCFFFFGDGKI